MTANFLPTDSRRNISPNRNLHKSRQSTCTLIWPLYTSQGMKKHLETLKFPSEEFTLSISLALAECFNIQSEYTIEKCIWNSSLKIKEGKQSGEGSGKHD